RPRPCPTPRRFPRARTPGGRQAVCGGGSRGRPTTAAGLGLRSERWTRVRGSSEGAGDATGGVDTSVAGGVTAGIAAYTLWGFFPAFFPLLEPAGALEILGNRIVWSLVVM